MAEKIKVLHIIKSLGRGGAEMLLPETLLYHDQTRFEFHYIYFLPWKDQMVSAISEGGGKVTCLSASNNISIMLKASAVRKYIQANGIMVVHCHLPWAGILGRIVGKMTHLPVIYTEHNKQERYHFGTRTVNLLTMNLLTKIVAVSDDVADSIRKNKPALRRPVQTIVNGVNIEKFDRTQFDGSIVRRQLGIPDDAIVIGTVAVFRFQKRLDHWMELASEIAKRINNVHFIIVGDGPLKDKLIRRRAGLNMTERIHLPGLETEVRPYLASFDLFMMCSIYEGLPIALLEAMAMSCPVISTDAGGIREVIRNEIDGLICPVHESSKLVDYADMLCRDPRARAEYSMRARKRVEENYSLKVMVTRLEEVYQQYAMDSIA